VKKIRTYICILITGCFISWSASAQSAENSLTVVSKPKSDAFCLVDKGIAADIVIDPVDADVVRIAAEAFRNDVALVTGIRPVLREDIKGTNRHVVIVGSLEGSHLIDRLAKQGKLTVNRIREQWETFMIAVVDSPIEGIDRALVIAGSDRRGTAFGMFELSRMIGVSPWVWWADVIPEHRDALYVTSGTLFDGPPSVKYRGIFLNDEDWGLKPWASKNMDPDIRDIGPNTYEKVFELMLRLKANYLWPAMHECTKAFNYYPENPKLADRYAIVMGSSHCEPLLRNNVTEWTQDFENEYGETPGEWRYDKNRSQIYRYWEDRVRTNASYESIFTIGMRGIHDTRMPGPDDMNAKITLLEEVIGDQRGLLERYRNRPIERIPQMFCPYKEVLLLYQEGMWLPDDITIVWADDNFGYIRQLSTPEEQRRSGESGIYYHFSYYGIPRDYLWLATTPTALTSFEMTKAYRFGASRIWIFNVGDLKPAELETEFAMDLAWDIDSWPPAQAYEYPTVWAARTFGPEFAESIGRIKNLYYLLANEGKPEHLDMLMFNAEDAAERLAAYRTIAAEAESLGAVLPERLRDTYFELVLYPVQASALMNEKVLWARRSLELAGHDDDAALEYAEKARGAFERIIELTRIYNEDIADGKWSGMMSYHPRNLRIFDMPRVAGDETTGTSRAGFIMNPDVNNEAESARIIISASSFVRKHETPGISICSVPGLGIGGKNITIMPFTAAPIPDEEVIQAPYVEYETMLAEGERTVTVKCLPTQRIHEGRGLRYAVSVNVDEPQVVDVHTTTESFEWRRNVIRGYSMGRSTHHVAAGTAVVRISLLDTGLVINEIEVK